MKKISLILIAVLMVFMAFGCTKPQSEVSVESSKNSTIQSGDSKFSQNSSVKSAENVTSEGVKSGASNSLPKSTTSTGGGTKPTIPTNKVTSIAQAEKRGMPIMFLNTAGEVEINSKDYLKNNNVAIYDNSGSVVLANQEKVKVKLRGNTTATFDKKPYALKFDKDVAKVQPFGLGSNKCERWNLLANRCDRTFIRNSLGLTFCENMGIDYVPDFQEVELYYNGNYRGAYLLCEAVNEEVGRVNISSKTVDGTIDADYLVVLSKNSTEPTCFFDSEGVKYEIKNDINSKKDEEQLGFVKSKFDNALQVVKAGDKTEVSKVIDINSAVDAYIIEETLNNMDVGWDSFYFTVRQGQPIKFGPLWDFDVSMGNGNDDSQYSTGFNACKKANETVAQSRSNLWFYYLSQQKWFREAVATRWKSQTVQTALSNLSSNVSAFSSKYEQVYKLDFALWNDVSSGKLEKINFENDNILNAITYDSQVSYLQTWIDERIAWLNGAFSSVDYINGAMPKHSEL